MGDFEVLFFQPSPWGEGGWPLGQTDEGTGFGLPFVERTVQLGFALRGEFLFHVEKEPKDARGSAQDGHSVSIFAAPPRTPLRGTRTCWVLQNFRRAKFEWRFLVQSGPLGPGAVKNCGWCGSTSAPGFAEQVAAGPLSRDGLGPSPTKWGTASVFAVGAGPRPARLGVQTTPS